MWDHRYRKLKKGEIIQEGDEVGISGPGMNGELKWRKPQPDTIGTKAPDPSFISHRWYRRLKPNLEDRFKEVFLPIGISGKESLINECIIISETNVKSKINPLIEKYESRKEELSQYHTQQCRAICHELASVIYDLKNL